jgi:hypothetical protein
MREVRYWHEITRSHWVNRLGNLVLLQPSGQQVSQVAMYCIVLFGVTLNLLPLYCLCCCCCQLFDRPTDFNTLLPPLLLPLLQSASTGHLSADLAVKLGHYAACAADEHFPEFTGGLVSGRYTRDCFCPEECRQRHGDIITRWGLLDALALA